ncbi:sensor histidine kinase [Nocardioides speluncae]|uniref:sensor histidine kinase n=1 Tax=Nocardioides speluncae TaxID=2670337 RepID=UPI000D69CA27|nr:histidine kinase [Nocardioides speluncae]
MTGRWILRRTVFLLIGGAILVANATLVLGVVSVAVPDGAPGQPLLMVLTLLAVGLVGLLPGLRELQVAAAQTLLGADGVVVPTPMRWEHRWRTVLWCVLHQAVGFLLGLGLVLVAIGVTATLMLATGSRPQLDPGPPQPGSPVEWFLLVLVPFGLLVAVAIGAWFAGVAARWAAPLLLGPLGTDRLAVAEARLRQELEYRRLSRDLHDGVGHALSAISLQAEAGRRQLARDPDRADESMAAIAALASAAVDELDHALGVLRDGLAPRSPGPGLPELPDLVAAHRSLGMSLDASTGEVGEVPALVSHMAYRVCAEGLTNAAKHGVAGPVVLTVDRSLGGLRLEVRNPIDRRRSPDRAGRGLDGLREQVAILDGELVAQSIDTEWVLQARLPLGVAGSTP